MSIESNLKVYAENELNVLLIGKHGIGKSTVAMKIVKEMNLKMKYYSASTLDPYSELIGIPVPDKEKKTIEFYRPKDLDNAEFVFFDELNRAHPRVLDAVLEIIQFKSVNGVKLPNLKMVWAAINPPNDNYKVEEMDPALVDRFHMYVKMLPKINLGYMKTKMSEPIARAVKEWWDAMNKEQQSVLTPRRLEYIGVMLEKGIPWTDALPPGGYTFDRKGLAELLKIARGEKASFIINKENVLNRTKELVEILKEDVTLMPKVAGIVRPLNEEQIFEIRNVLELLPRDLLQVAFDEKWPDLLEKIVKRFENRGLVDRYPRTIEALMNKINGK